MYLYLNRLILDHPTPALNYQIYFKLIFFLSLFVKLFTLYIAVVNLMLIIVKSEI